MKLKIFVRIAAIFYVEHVAVLTMTWSYVKIAVIVYLLIIEPEPEPESFPPWRQRDNIMALKVYFCLYE